MSKDINELKIGVVTVTYNAISFLDEFLDSLKVQTHKNFQVYLIDNNSSDGTSNYLSKNNPDFKNIEVTQNKNNIGVAAANNQGIKSALQDKCDYVLLLNNDTFFPENLFSLLLQGSVKTGLNLSAPKMFYADAPNTLWWGGGYFDKLRFFSGRHSFYNEIDSGQSDEQKEFDYCPTCCLLINSQVFESVGLMDEKYFVYYDDVDFCLRLYRAGIKGKYVADAKLWHKVSSSTGGSESDFTVRYMLRNRAYFIKKNLNYFYSASYVLYLTGITLWKYLLGKTTSKMLLNVIRHSNSGFRL